jgi:hypothetical protein
MFNTPSKGLLQTCTGEVVGAVERGRQPAVGVGLGGQHPCPLELQHQPGERVGEHVVHVTGEPAALAQHRRFGFRVAARLKLKQ